MAVLSIVFGICAAVYLAIPALILVQARLSRTGELLAMACLCTAAWAAVELIAPRSFAALALDLARGLGWYGFAFHLYGRVVTGRTGRTLFRSVGIAMLLAAIAALTVLFRGALVPGLSGVTITQLCIALGTLLLVENLYWNTPPDRRWHVNLLCIAIALFGIYDVLLAATVELTGQWPTMLRDGQAVVMVTLAPLLVFAAPRNRSWAIDIHVSREVVFHSATLIVSGLFLLSLVASGEILRHLEGDLGGVAEISLVFAGIAVVATVLTSASVRSRIRALLVDHFFTHRYDYRAEWVRTLRLLAPNGVYTALHARAIRALADVVDSTGGVLMLREPGDAGFHWAGSLNAPAATVTLEPDHPLLRRFDDDRWVSEIGDLADIGVADLWLAISLQQHGELLGIVLLTRSRAGFKLDAEALELLKMVGHEVGSHVAEQQASQRLLRARQFQEYGKNFAFVMHDIKNVSGQLGMLLSNAEQYIEDPEFQQDMLATVRSSIQRIGTVIRRLETGKGAAAGAIVPAARLREIIGLRERLGMCAVLLDDDGQQGFVAMDGMNFDATIEHLLNNAVEAAGPGAELGIRVRHSTRQVTIEIVDRGPGMSAEFIRDHLFTPFTTSKPAGTGIGAFQARSLLREVGGDLRVASEPGRGTTMGVVLPLLESAAREILSPVA